MTLNKLSLLVIAGGKSSRLGRDKRQVQLGKLPLLEITLAKGQKAGFEEIFLCAEAPSPFLIQLAEKYSAQLVFDAKPGLGPVSGLAQGLSSMGTTWALAVAGDMPFLDLGELCAWGNGPDATGLALVPSAAGRLQPLAAFYRRETASYFQRALHEDVRKIGKVLASFPHAEREYSGSPACFFNVNTQADLRLARGRFANLHRPVPLVSVTAPASGTGKTTFIEKLLPLLRAKGIKAGVVKSDSHGFDLDVQGKDSFRFQEAGACSVAVVSPRGWFMVQKREGRAPLEEIAAKMEAADLILTESRSHGTLPALSLWRGRGEPQRQEDVAALFTSAPGTETTDLHEYHIDNTDKAVELCLFLMGR